MGQPRIVVVSRNLPPLRGGMERLAQHLVVTLARRYHCVVVGPPGCASALPDSVDCHECASTRALPFLLEALLRVLLLAPRAGRPVAVIATSGLTAPVARLYAALVRAPLVSVVHGLDLVAASRVYQHLFVPAIRASDVVIANSANTARLAVARGVAGTTLRVVHPGVDWPGAAGDGAAFRARHDLEQRPVLLAVGRLTARKGLPEFVDRCLPALVTTHPSLALVVIGGEARDAVRRETSVRERIETAAARHDLAGHVRLLGPVPDAELACAYAAADLHVFPLVPVAGDVEGFGMVAAEAAAHGLYTVAFDEGGVADAVVEGITGTLVPSGDYDACAHAIRESLAGDGAERRAACRAAAARYSWEVYAERLEAALTAIGR